LSLTDQRKVFINITTHETIDPPAMKKRLDESGEEVEGMNIPMSVGSLHMEKDKKNVESDVYDIVVHPSVVQDIANDNTGKFREFLCQLGIQCLENKYKLQLDKRYKLPKLVYMGDAENVPKQYIQDRKAMPRIEEVKKATKPGTKLATNNITNKGKSGQDNTRDVIPEKERDVTGKMYWVSVPPQHLAGVSTQDETQSRVKAIVRDCLSPSFSSFIQPPIQEEMKSSEQSLCNWHPYLPILTEYLDPILMPNNDEEDITHLVLVVDFQSFDTLENLRRQLLVSMSPYKLQLSLPEYKSFTAHFSLAIEPNHSSFFVQHVEGFVSLRRLFALLEIDNGAWEDNGDAGSKPWLLSLAIDDNAQSNPYKQYNSSTSSTSVDTNQRNEDGDGLAEDKFHLSLPADVDQYTGVKLDDNSAGGANMDDWELPEDRFHKKDAGSSYLLGQREQTKKEKWDKYEKLVSH
jgi:hypothetical protein